MSELTELKEKIKKEISNEIKGNPNEDLNDSMEDAQVKLLKSEIKQVKMTAILYKQLIGNPTRNPRVFNSNS